VVEGPSAVLGEAASPLLEATFLCVGEQPLAQLLVLKIVQLEGGVAVLMREQPRAVVVVEVQRLLLTTVSATAVVEAIAEQLVVVVAVAEQLEVPEAVKAAQLVVVAVAELSPALMGLPLLLVA